MIETPGPGWVSPGRVVGLRGGRSMVWMEIVERLVMLPVWLLVCLLIWFNVVRGYGKEKV